RWNDKKAPKTVKKLSKSQFFLKIRKLNWTVGCLKAKLECLAIWPVLCFFDLKIVDTIRNGKKSNEHNLSTFKE
ncbi:MAG TPA: hypothetical protein VHP63_04625, partial [candidate division Zixibacteria bacterium]|nr:hypothetical protein [candidate division Zixibacteria bacterium]